MNVKSKFFVFLIIIFIFSSILTIGFYLGIYASQASTFSLNHEHTVQLALIRKELNKKNYVEAYEITDRIIIINSLMLKLLREEPWRLSLKRQEDLGLINKKNSEGK